MKFKRCATAIQRILESEMSVLDNLRMDYPKNYTDNINDQMSSGGIIESICSFKPDLRKGKTVSTREYKIQRRSARILYFNRMKIARNIVDSEFDSPRKVLSSALMKSGISPSTFPEWTSYVLLLSERNGGWERFLSSLRKELNILDNFSRRDKLSTYYLALSLVLFIFSVISSFGGGYSFSDVFLLIASPLITTYCFIVFFKNRFISQSASDIITGKDDKSQSYFVESNKFLSLL